MKVHIVKIFKKNFIKEVQSFTFLVTINYRLEKPTAVRLTVKKI